MTKYTFIRVLFHALLVRPLVWGVLGLNIRHRERLPRSGPLIIVANHNNHLDTLVLMSLFPLRALGHLSAAAAADYFLRNRLLKWVSLTLFGIIPVRRQGWRRGDGDPLADLVKALEHDRILIVYPEGTRGEPELCTRLKPGVAHLARRCPEVPVIPVFLHGLGKTLPKGSAVLVPFCCDVVVGKPLRWNGGINAFMTTLADALAGLAHEQRFPEWL